MALVDGRFESYVDTQMRGQNKCIYEEYHYRSASAFQGLFIGIRPRTLSANAYDDYAYSMKGAITYGIFSNAGNRPIPWVSGWTRRT
jgi:hypothetical protein